MPQLHLQEFLLKHSGKSNNVENAIGQLKEKLAIKNRRHSKFPNLILFKYNQIESPMANPIVQESRGIILDSEDSWKVVSYPYNKFFNQDEGHAAKLDWEGGVFSYEKLDGSLMSIYNYRGRWYVSTSGTPDACGNVHGFDFTFSELFWKTWNDLGYQYPDTEDENKTFMFEMMTPYNRVVVPHKESKLVLHGVRENDTFREWNPERFANPAKVPFTYNWACVQRFDLNSPEKVAEAAAKLNGMECEGFVIVDTKFNRVKVKCLEYVTYAHMKEGMSLRDLLEIVRSNEGSEMLAYFPEFTNEFNRIKEVYEAFVKEVETFYDSIKDIEDQKAFALKAITTRYSGILFMLKKGHCASVKEGLKSIDIKSLEQLLKIKNLQISNF